MQLLQRRIAFSGAAWGKNGALEQAQPIFEGNSLLGLHLPWFRTEMPVFGLGGTTPVMTPATQVLQILNDDNHTGVHYLPHVIRQR